MNKESLVSVAELESLIQGWGAAPHAQAIDKFFPIRAWYLLLIVLAYGIVLLFYPGVVSGRLVTEPVEIHRISLFLYFRGWFLLLSLVVGFYAYFKNRYMGIVFSGLLLVGCVNFIFDLFNVYEEVLASPTPRMTLALIGRLVALWFLFLTVKNVSRVPNQKDRFNILLPFKAGI